MNPIVAVLCFAVAAQASLLLPDSAKEFVTKKTQYDLYKLYSESISLETADQEHAYHGLDHDGSGKIDKKDLELFYWHTDLAYAIPKFIALLDDKKDNAVEKSELTNDFMKKEIRVALIECHYLKSPGLKQSCFADQLATYASLVLDDTDVKGFYESIAGADKHLSTEEVHALKSKGFEKLDLEITAEELGAHDGNDGVTLEEFKDYVRQESINDDFRRCRKSVDVATGNVDFIDTCLLHELIEYTNDDLTEMDISVLFRAFDKDGSKKITKQEFQAQLPDSVNFDKLMETLDMSLTTHKDASPEVDYGEFRTYLKSPTVQIQAERDCTEPKKTQIDELNCLYDLFVTLATESHDAIWLVVPDLEQQIAFEVIDEDNNGVIKIEELKQYDAEAKKMFVAEIDTNDAGEDVDLEEFNEYMDIPHMVYGTGDCLLETKTGETRGKCYAKEVHSLIDNIKHVKENFWQEWFEFYDSNSNGVIKENDANEVKEKFGENEKLFLLELGQGDATITLFEFTWYVKQQELSKQYNGKSTVEEYHAILNTWIADHLTEYDIQEFFAALDAGKKDHELTKEDFGSNWANIEKLIKKIDGYGDDKDNTVNFREFWLWIQTGQVKKVFEDKCTKPKQTQTLEVKCYADLFKDHPESFS